jgi:hypothetical protein
VGNCGLCALGATLFTGSAFLQRRFILQNKIHDYDFNLNLKKIEKSASASFDEVDDDNYDNINDKEEDEINLSLPGASIILQTNSEAHSPKLQDFCLTHSISVVRDLSYVLPLDLGLFSTKTLVTTDPNHGVEVIYIR